MSRIPTIIFAALLLGACRTPGYPIAFRQEIHPEAPKVEVHVTAQGAPGDYLASITLRNLTGETFWVSPGSFVLEDQYARPFYFSDWSYFGGARFTPHTPRQLLPGQWLQGNVRWRSNYAAVGSVLRVRIGPEEHDFIFGDAYGPPPPGPGAPGAPPPGAAPGGPAGEPGEEPVEEPGGEEEAPPGGGQ